MLGIEQQYCRENKNSTELLLSSTRENTWGDAGLHEKTIRQTTKKKKKKEKKEKKAPLS